jgi:iron(III) transport system ATP-binding protein
MLRIVSLSKHFGSTVAVDDVSLEVEQGEFLSLLGPSGCGKTTTLRMIAGFETPTSGQILLDDRDVSRLPPQRRGFGMVFQNYALFPHLNVFENVAFGLKAKKIPAGTLNERVAQALARVDLTGYERRAVQALSGGQQQRVALARALAPEPPLLLLDEPLSNLDAQLRVEMRREIRRIVKDNGLTAVYVTHDQEEALAMADRMAVLTRGRIGQVGTPEEIYRQPRSAHVAGFIGETNLVDGVVIRCDGGFCEVRTTGGTLQGRLTDPGWLPEGGEKVRVSVRPEAWRLHQDHGDNPLAGRVVERAYLGQRIQYWIETAVGRQQVVEMNPHIIHDPGDDSVLLHARLDDVVVLRVAGMEQGVEEIQKF